MSGSTFLSEFSFSFERMEMSIERVSNAIDTDSEASGVITSTKSRTKSERPEEKTVGESDKARSRRPAQVPKIGGGSVRVPSELNEPTIAASPRGDSSTGKNPAPEGDARRDDALHTPNTLEGNEPSSERARYGHSSEK